ncbi:MAG: hypothetical protein JNL61_03555 [Rhizobiaceae bacterium]|nr:hypothetical protein [Rhizobiaceae bacterium]
MSTPAAPIDANHVETTPVRLDRAASIVDSLFCLPDAEGDAASPVERAVLAKLQQDLARKMRSMVEAHRSAA